MSDERWVPGNKSELMSCIEHEWNLLMEAVSKLDEAKMTSAGEGGWSPKDNLAHIAEWMGILMGYHLDRRPPSEVLDLSDDVTKDWDFNAINAILFERSRDRSTQNVLDGLKAKYGEMVKKLDEIPFEDLLKPRFDDDPEKQPVLLWILSNTIEHFREHRAEIEKHL